MPCSVIGLADVTAQLGERALVSFASSDDELVAVVLAGGKSRLIRLGSAAGAAEAARMLNVDLNALALNRIRPGDEALGFASALLASGSRTVIAPLSRVGDEAAAAAMDDYHRGLAEGAGPATALADTIAVDPFRRPFVCLGAG